jgi:hypothetical protein
VAVSLRPGREVKQMDMGATDSIGAGD